jgi:hypothetical protein
VFLNYQCEGLLGEDSVNYFSYVSDHGGGAAAAAAAAAAALPPAAALVIKLDRGASGGW